MLTKALIILTGCTVLASPALAAGLDQAALDAAARTLAVRYAVIDNQPPDLCGEATCFKAELTLTAPAGLPGTGWSFYFSHVEPVLRIEAEGFRLEHVNGDLHRLRPTAPLAPGRAYRIGLRAAGSFLSEYYPMPNAYLAADGLEARVVESTRPQRDPETGLEVLPFVAPFTDEARLARRGGEDRTDWASAARLYPELAALADAAAPAPGADILPMPLSTRLDPAGGTVDLSGGVTPRLLGFDPSALAAALDALARAGVPARPGGVGLEVRRGGSYPAGGYRLALAAGGIAVEAADEEGAANALRSLVALADGRVSKTPMVVIDDAPRFGFRGLHLDLARNFHSKALVLKLLEQMAAYKLNRLHLHLADDEGWRVEIPGLPELTQVGARRCHDPAEDRCLLPQLGSGPTGVSSVDGFFSTEDYVEIVRAAAARHIEVIPSFDMPGHARAAIRAMDARARRLRAAGQPVEAARYVLSEAADRSVYDSVQHYNDNTVNVCLPSAYAFVDKVVGEIAALHAQAGQPLGRYHLGADETPGAWTASRACAELSRNRGVPVERLGGHFIELVARRFADRGIVVGGWSDGLEATTPAAMPARVQSNNWTRLFEGAAASANRQANRGWEVVISTPDATYLDAPSAVDPKERGYDWMARATDLKKLFEFMPENLDAHAQVWRDDYGRAAKVEDAEPLKPGVRYAGLQGQLWSETIRSDEQVEYMLFPRLLALAERAWRRASWEPGAGELFTPARLEARGGDWRRFAAIVGRRELGRLDRAGVAYRLPPPGAVIDGTRLRTAPGLPGLPVERRIDGGTWEPADGAAPATGTIVEVRSRSPDGRRAGRTLKVETREN